MTHDEFHRTIQDAASKALRMLGQKNHDYVAGSENAFAAFDDTIKDTRLGRTSAWWVFFSKHVRAIKQFTVGKGGLSTEDIQSRLLDVINYSLILYAMIEDWKSGGLCATDLRGEEDNGSA